MSSDLLGLIRKEGWEVNEHRGEEGKFYRVSAFGQEFPFTHPTLIHLKLYRTETNPDQKYYHMKAAHDYLWPNKRDTWHYWTEERFREHCAGWNYIGWAGGASTTKSYDAATILNLFWLANPRERTVIVASTTLESLSSRVWGYSMNLLSKMQVKIPFQYLGGGSPKILYPSKGGTDIRDTVHGMFAVAAKHGDEESAISSIIGRHPTDSLMVILDEATDLNPAIVKAFPNLDSSEKPFQLIAIGNSNSIHDLHGSICTPKKGWASVDPLRDHKWETTRKNGICLFFSCYASPAIHETNAVKKKLLGRFLITGEQIAEKEKLLGKGSDSFWRFVLGFWRSSSTDKTVVTRAFLNTHNVMQKAEWLGLRSLQVVGGLDPSFSTGGDDCILRLAYLGQSISGEQVLDFRGEDLLFKIMISAQSRDSIEIQITNQVLRILNQFGCELHNVAIDASGQGRALGGTLQLGAKVARPPIKIFTTRTGMGKGAVNSFDVLPKTKDELWFDMRTFMEHGQIRGLDAEACNQFASRLVIQNEKTLKQELESKAEYKRRMAGIDPRLAHSPDRADAATLALQVAIMNFGFYPGQAFEVVKAGETEELRKIAMWKAQQQMVAETHGREVPVADFSSDVFSYDAGGVFRK